MKRPDAFDASPMTAGGSDPEIGRGVFARDFLRGILGAMPRGCKWVDLLISTTT
jgi:hypothetical protein